MTNPKLTAARAKLEAERGPLVEVPREVSTLDELRAFDAAMHRKHGKFRRRTHPLDSQPRLMALTADAEPSHVELPPEIAEAERRILARDPTFTEADYALVLAALHAFDDAQY